MVLTCPGAPSSQQPDPELTLSDQRSQHGPPSPSPHPVLPPQAGNLLPAAIHQAPGKTRGEEGGQGKMPGTRLRGWDRGENMERSAGGEARPAQGTKV